jgi:hypothetical protein
VCEESKLSLVAPRGAAERVKISHISVLIRSLYEEGTVWSTIDIMTPTLSGGGVD